MFWFQDINLLQHEAEVKWQRAAQLQGVSDQGDTGSATTVAKRRCTWTLGDPLGS